ncbi:esterase-like activity of phytase family protein [Pseudomonas sp. ZM23]|uniref:Esterase-like activity of phytase family protein n=1 Tax=Pseudomonas triclosanedens TaxID=2961893 RepID=A0ABY6ZWF8_9PSED|nr:esterase-like activity of phytase family protein [Pseudomonas triclosanedens]MCP8465132.1 esterase-like activity of phytase family protein [Pseudomonas triclosanedens]MCP8470928.1 esterase-like activity of phytase family protein [Pseudomonas triclosanedens]MCP8476432.1 esterase-like activity of phytase family protein [Pseudomonas triclosanedens]WAI49111.1 esterase-like activity of phytase family protein [Pseudomonas triclosanedens]
MRWLPAALGLFAGLALADPAPTAVPNTLQFISEHPVEGMPRGNLSGLAQCGDELWAVSDRDDDRIYRMLADESPGSVWQATPEAFVVSGAPDSGLSWGMRTRVLASGLVRGGALDFEGISCDKAGNRYVVSEAYAGVLLVPVTGDPAWLPLPQSLLRQARASGLLMSFNALYEGLTIDPDGKTLWLAAERQRRGLLRVRNENGTWKCDGNCVLLSEGGVAMPPPELGSERALPIDFSDLALYKGKLFTLERLAHQICRRDAGTGAQEQCWSFAAGALAPERRYDLPYGVAEALIVDDKGAWIGLDNGERARADGDARPFVLRFAAPVGGWLGGK